ncbi:hypothetical protein COCCADRAFT_82587, partial [Bipolaris zeicola 26-R-13]
SPSPPPPPPHTNSRNNTSNKNQGTSTTPDTSWAAMRDTVAATRIAGRQSVLWTADGDFVRRRGRGGRNIRQCARVWGDDDGEMGVCDTDASRRRAGGGVLRWF